MIKSKNTIAIPPGATIREQLEYRGMCQKEFAKRMDMSEKHISRLINGKVELTQGTSLRLENVLGIPANFWNNMEIIYQEQAARAREDIILENDIAIAEKMPYAECAGFGWLPKTRKTDEKVRNLRKYFEVANLGILEDLRLPGIAYRAVGKNDSADYALCMWAQKARIEARNVKTDEINIKELKQMIPELRTLTLKDPNDFCNKLTACLAKCGIALIFLPHIRGSFLHGATFIDGNHIVLGLTVRGKYADKFWFSFFHEIGHIIYGHINNSTGDIEEEEQIADEFSGETLIPVDEYREIEHIKIFSRYDIVNFSNKIGIAPGIVLGRLQRENRIDFNKYNDLKVMYGLT